MSVGVMKDKSVYDYFILYYETMKRELKTVTAVQ
jgi:hypothetical protein